MDNQELSFLANKIRLESMRCISSVGGGHVGGVLSLAELMAVLYGDVMNYDSKNPRWEYRDRLVMSKGHCGPVQYAALALSGFFPLDELLTLNQPGTRLPSHCNRLTPGIELSTGSLGQGASLAAGIALGLKRKTIPAFSYLILGDGECDEGQVWEMAAFASHYKLDNLIAFVDVNKQQLDGYTVDVMDMGSLKDKFMSFGWNCSEVNGHKVDEIRTAIEEAKQIKNKPKVILLNTIKGKGYSKTENQPNVHYIEFSKSDFNDYEKELAIFNV